MDRDYSYYDDICFECEGYGDEYFENEYGDLEPCCWSCPYNPNKDYDWYD